MPWVASAVPMVAAATSGAWAASQIKTARLTAAWLPRRSYVRAKLVFQRIRCVVRMGAIVRQGHIA